LALFSLVLDFSAEACWIKRRLFEQGFARSLAVPCASSAKLRWGLTRVGAARLRGGGG